MTGLTLAEGYHTPQETAMVDVQDPVTTLSF